MEFDVAVIGGGPAGSTCAAALARRGRKVLVLERERFPRFHIGESLLPLSDEILSSIGVGPRFAAEGFVEKWGATFLTEDGESTCRYEFAHGFDVPQPRTYQVVRSHFDQLLLVHAQASGARVEQEARALDVSFDEDGVDVEWTDAGGKHWRSRAAALVDASGQAGFLARRFSLRSVDPTLRKTAVFAHYHDVPRLPDPASGDIRVVSRRDMGWFWVIPLAGGLTSVGVVFDSSEGALKTRASAEAILDHAIAETPAMAKLMGTSGRASPARFQGDFSYSARAYAGDRWLAVGDAGSFIDPVFSTGVQIALRSALDAAECLDRAFSGGAFRRSSFRAYEIAQRRRYKLFRRFVTGFYEPAFRDLFFHPEVWPAGYRSVVSVLAGNERPSFAVRARIELIFLIVRLQRWIRLVPRLHRPPNHRAAALRRRSTPST